jgi:thiosulfate reductase cytochrome b subunit
MYAIMPLLPISGGLFLRPDIVPKRIFGIDGLLSIALVGFVMAFTVCCFLVLHLYLCTSGATLPSDL